MYQFSYDEVLEDDQSAARRTEDYALGRVIDLLNIAAAAPPKSREGVEALHYTFELWSTFVHDLSSEQNALPPEVRGNLLSIGIWVLKEVDAIRLGTSTNYAGIADICTIIRDGLR